MSHSLQDNTRKNHQEIAQGNLNPLTQMHQTLEIVHSWTALMHLWKPKKGLVLWLHHQKALYLTRHYGRQEIRNPHLCFEAARFSLRPGWSSNAGGAPSLVAPSARGNHWLGREVGRQKRVLRSTPQLNPFSFPKVLSRTSTRWAQLQQEQQHCLLWRTRWQR